MADSVRTVVRALLLSVTLYAVATAARAERADVIVVWDKIVADRHQMALLDYALAATRDVYGDYRLIVSEPLTRAQAFSRLRQSLPLHVASGGVDARRERSLLPVHVPLAGGLAGARVCLIRAGDGERFRAVDSINDWNRARLRIGVLRADSSAVALAAAAPEAVYANSETRLFSLLADGTVDCVPVRLHDVFNRLGLHRDDGVELERRLLLYHPQYDIFYVDKDDHRIAERLYLGLRKAVEDGFYRRRYRISYRDTLERIDPLRRTLLEFDDSRRRDGLSPQARRLREQRAVNLLPFGR